MPVLDELIFELLRFARGLARLRWLVLREVVGRVAVFNRVSGEGILVVGAVWVVRGWKPALCNTAACPEDALASALRGVDVIMGGSALEPDPVGENSNGSVCTGVCA